MEHTAVKNMELVTVREFVEYIWHMMQTEVDYAAACEDKDAAIETDGPQNADPEDIWMRGTRKKWLEPQDVSDRDAFIERRHAARILHEFLKKERQEPDLRDWDMAKCLLDLYDCRTCVNHVAQVYCKGVMEGITEHIFGMKEGVLREELAPVMERLFAPSKRIKRKRKCSNQALPLS